MMEYTVHHKEKLYFALSVVASFIAYLGLLSFAFFANKNVIFVVYYVIFFFCIRFLAGIFLAGFLKGNGIRITPKQFPEIFEILKKHCGVLDLKEIPDAYVLQGNGMLNAFATRFARRNFVVLYSDVLEVAFQEGKDAVSFILGHELGHIKRNHVGLLKMLFTLPAQMIPFLVSAYSRACEYTCDNIGYHLSPEGASKGLLILGAGKQLYKRVNVPELLRTIEYGPGFAFWFVEIFSSHPALIKRLDVINQLDRDNLRSETPVFTSPKIDITDVRAQR